MAPSVPAEIDLFTIPHSRMKELVNTCTEKVQCVDFRDCQETFNLLKELQTTFYEFKSHEWIENLFIMDQLKNRLKQRHIYNSAVCDCHNDNRLTEMLSLVRQGKHLPKSNIGERLNFGEELQKSFYEFVQQFLPHMEEEENIFQPLLVEHFEYDELRALKEVVLEQHELFKDPLHQEKAELDLPETDTAIKDFRDLDSDVRLLPDSYRIPQEMVLNDKTPSTPCVQVSEKNCYESFFESPNITNEMEFSNQIEERNSFTFPPEILISIFSLLTPPDRGRCARVCSQWNNVIYSFSLWKAIYPIQWARGIWAWSDANLCNELEDEAVSGCSQYKAKYDEDADVDESEEVAEDGPAQHEHHVFDSIISYLLPKIGRGVEKLVLDAGRGIKPLQIRGALHMCRNVKYLSAAYTSFDALSLQGFGVNRGLKKLAHLDLQGCVNVGDECLAALAQCLRPPRITRCPIRVCGGNPQSRKIRSTGDVGRICCYSSSSNPSPSPNPNLFAPNPSTPRNCPFLSPQTWSTSASTDSSDEAEGDLEIEELHIAKKRRNKRVLCLEHLNFSGCPAITERGLVCLLNQGLLERVSYLNISSCSNVAGVILGSIIYQCRHLKPENLTYCNNIANGPYPSLASGCDNIYHPLKFCCQARMDL